MGDGRWTRVDVKTVLHSVAVSIVILLGTQLSCSYTTYLFVVNHREEPIHITYTPGKFENYLALLSHPEQSTAKRFSKVNPDRFVPMSTDAFDVDSGTGRVSVTVAGRSAVKIGNSRASESPLDVASAVLTIRTPDGSVEYTAGEAFGAFEREKLGIRVLHLK